MGLRIIDLDNLGIHPEAGATDSERPERLTEAEVEALYDKVDDAFSELSGGQEIFIVQTSQVVEKLIAKLTPREATFLFLMGVGNFANTVTEEKMGPAIGSASNINFGGPMAQA